MAIFKILQYPQDLAMLRRVGVEVKEFDDSFQQIIDSMFETLYTAKNCAALAATQLDIPNAPFVTVIDFSTEKDQPLCLVNAKIISSDGYGDMKEGCMSVNSRKGRSVAAVVQRANSIKLEAQDRYGRKIELTEDGFMARCIQHELDHLHGKLYIDYLQGLRRKMIDRKISS